MAVIVFLVLAIALVGGLIAFSRAVFGGATFRRERGKKGGDDGRGPRADGHAGATNWPHAGWSQWLDH